MNDSAASKEQMAPKVLAAISDEQLISGKWGILTGGGGGFTMEYMDFIVDADGGATVNHYFADLSTGQPVEMKEAPLLRGERRREAERLMAEALAIGFFEIELESPQASMVRHTAVAHPDHGLHRIVWSLSATPSPPPELVAFDRQVRDFLSKGFAEEIAH